MEPHVARPKIPGFSFVLCTIIAVTLPMVGCGGESSAIEQVATATRRIATATGAAEAVTPLSATPTTLVATKPPFVLTETSERELFVDVGDAEVPVNKVFKRSGWDFGHTVLPSPDGGYLIIGSEDRGEMCLFLKVDSDAEIEWETIISNEEIYTTCRFLTLTADGGCLVLADLYKYDANSRRYYGGMIITKVDEDGQVVWQKRYEDGWQDAYRHAHHFGVGAGVLMDDVGDFNVIKIDYQGNVVAAQDYGFYYSLISVVPSSDGGYVMLVKDEEARGGDVVNARLIKANANGETEWDKVFLVDRELFEREGSMRHIFGSEGRMVQQTPDGGFLVAGYVWQEAVERTYRFWQLETDSQGNIVGVSTSKQLWAGEHMIRTADGGYLIAGEREGVPVVMKLDAGGVLEWQRTFPGEEDTELQLWEIAEGPDGLYVGVGNSGSLGGKRVNIWLIIIEDTSPD